jgi:transposase-like protein
MAPRDRRSYRTSSYWSAEEARAALADQQASGLSVIGFAEREGLQAQRLYVWRRRLADEKSKASSAPPFIELRPLRPVSQTIEVMLLGGLVVKAPADIAPDTLASLIAALERSSGC